MLAISKNKRYYLTTYFYALLLSSILYRDHSQNASLLIVFHTHELHSGTGWLTR